MPRGFVAGVVLLAATASGLPREMGTAEIGQIEIERAKLSRIDTDSAEFELAVSGMARKSVTVKSIFFQQLMVNGIAVRVPPIQGPLKLREGEEIRGIPDLDALVPFREIPSLSPLREMVAEGVAHIHGVALVQIQLNPFEMLAMRSTNVWAAINIDQDIGITLPGGILGRGAAFAALTAAEPVWVLGNEGQEWRRRRSEFAEHAQEALGGAAIWIECSYEIRGRAGETRQMHSQTLGFRLGSGNVLTTAEAVEPWAFDSAMAEALSRHEITINQDSIQITARGENGPLRMSEERARTEKEKKRHMLSARGKAAYRLRFRDGDDNAVVLALDGNQTGPQQTHQQPHLQYSRSSEPLDGEWRPAAVLRAELNAQTAPSVWITEVRKENGRCILKDPAGVTALGSPVWMEGGAVCLMQDDRSGSAIVNVLKSFPLE